MTLLMADVRRPADLEPALRAHYAEMPGLSLTPEQACRLCGVTRHQVAECERLLQKLVREGYLRQSRDGLYRRRA